MPGGLLQLVTFGAQDIFLTGNPQVTFFKIVYRRHTNFAIEPIKQVFDGVVDFGRKVSAPIDRNGDLMHKTYLVVDLPEILLEKTDQEIQDGITPEDQIILAEFNQALLDSLVLVEYYGIHIDAYRDAVARAERNEEFDDDFTEAILQTHYTGTNAIIIAQGNEIIGNEAIINTISFNIVIPETIDFLQASTLTYFEQKDIFLEVMDTTINALINSFRQERSTFFQLFEQRNSILTSYINFAWIRRIGHFLIDYIEIEIGGNVIDRHYGDWMNIWHELTKNARTETKYKKMIGDVSELTTFDNKKKPARRLYIPLQFWFCRTSGLAIPLVALRYHNIRFNIRFADLDRCAYIEEDFDLFAPKYNVSLKDAYLLVDYVYLDKDERRRFAQASHEYLIDQLQSQFFDDIENPNFGEELDFVHSTKELFWVCQKIEYITNPDGTNQNINPGNYSLTTEETGNPVETSRLDLNGHIRFTKQEGLYYGAVQPYQHHKATPAEGINIYSFSLHPEESQPSGACNMSRIDLINLLLTLNSTQVEEGCVVRIYATNFNVLRIMSGQAGLAFAI